MTSAQTLVVLEQAGGDDGFPLLGFSDDSGDLLLRVLVLEVHREVCDCRQPSERSQGLELQAAISACIVLNHFSIGLLDDGGPPSVVLRLLHGDCLDFIFLLVDGQFIVDSDPVWLTVHVELDLE